MTDNTKMREAMIDQDGAVWEKIGGAWSMYKPAQSVPVVGEPVAWDNFPGYLIDHQEGSIVTEENLQFWLSAFIKNTDYNKPTHSSPTAELTTLREKAARLEREIDPERVPEGWRAVPVEPTDEMIDAGCDAADAYRVDIVRAYLAMMSVSPEA